MTLTEHSPWKKLLRGFVDLGGGGGGEVFYPTGNAFFFLTFRGRALSLSPARQEESLPRWDCSGPPRNLRVRAASLAASPLPSRGNSHLSQTQRQTRPPRLLGRSFSDRRDWICSMFKLFNIKNT